MESIRRHYRESHSGEWDINSIRENSEDYIVNVLNGDSREDYDSLRVKVKLLKNAKHPKTHDLPLYYCVKCNKTIACTKSMSDHYLKMHRADAFDINKIRAESWQYIKSQTDAR
jgi:hypothetical protein